MTRRSGDRRVTQRRVASTRQEWLWRGGTLCKNENRLRGLLLRCEDAMDEGVFRQLRRRVKIELRHDLRFMKLDRLR